MVLGFKKKKGRRKKIAVIIQTKDPKQTNSIPFQEKHLSCNCLKKQKNLQVKLTDEKSASLQICLPTRGMYLGFTTRWS